MSDSILFFSFAEEAVKERELDHQQFIFNSSEIQILLTFEKRFNRQQFSFISLKLRLTEQFKVFCLSMIEKT